MLFAPLRHQARHVDCCSSRSSDGGIHLSRDTLQAEPVGAVREPPLRGFPGSAGILPAVDWRRCPEAGEDAGAPRVGLSRLKLVAKDGKLW